MSWEDVDICRRISVGMGPDSHFRQDGEIQYYL